MLFGCLGTPNHPASPQLRQSLQEKVKAYMAQIIKRVAANRKAAKEEEVRRAAEREAEREADAEIEAAAARDAVAKARAAKLTPMKLLVCLLPLLAVLMAMGVSRFD